MLWLKKIHHLGEEDKSSGWRKPIIAVPNEYDSVRLTRISSAKMGTSNEPTLDRKKSVLGKLNWIFKVGKCDNIWNGL